MKIYSAFLSLLLVGCTGVNPVSHVQSAMMSVASVSRPAAVGPHATTVIVVMMENRDYSRIIGSGQAPYIKGTLVPQGALMNQSHPVGHPSQPNYLAFFSGSTQGITDDSCPHTFTTPNLGQEVIGAGKPFDGYSESMPKDGDTDCTTRLYARKHNPWVNYKYVPASSTLIWFDLPGAQPTV